MVQVWPTAALEKHVATLQDAIKRGISDADADARGISRKYVFTYSFSPLCVAWDNRCTCWGIHLTQAYSEINPNASLNAKLLLMAMNNDVPHFETMLSD